MRDYVLNSLLDVVKWIIRNTFEVPRLCHFLDCFLSVVPRFVNGRSLKILYHVFNLQVSGFEKKQGCGHFQLFKVSTNLFR